MLCSSHRGSQHGAIHSSACSIRCTILASCSAEEDIYIIGGASVYTEALPLADRLCLTEVHDTPKEADAFFPNFNREEWEVDFLEKHEKDEKHAQDYDFIDYIRK